MELPQQQNLMLSIDGGTHEDYHLVRLYYSPYAGWFYRKRLQLIDDQLEGIRVQNALDIGTGSGIFIKELLNHAQNVTGIDIHESYHGVKKMLQAENVDLQRVELRQGSILEIPYPDASFDLAVCISVLEHFADPIPALQEISRVLKKGSVFVAGFPANTALTSTLFHLLGYRAREIHPATHTTILSALEKVFTVEKVQFFPSSLLKMYTVCKLRKR